MKKVFYPSDKSLALGFFVACFIVGGIIGYIFTLIN